MRIFDANSITVTTNPDPLTDNTLPPPGLLNYSAITTDTALATTTGLECAFVHGVRDLHVSGNMHEFIEGDLNSTIHGNEARSVDQTFRETVLGQYTLTVNGGWLEEQHGAVTRNYSLPVTDTFDQDHHVEQPESGDFEVKHKDNAIITGESIEISAGLKLEIAATIAIGIALTEFALKGLAIEYDFLKGEGTLVKLFEAEARVDLTAAHAHVETRAAVSASANAAPAVGVGTPVR